jgi:hypothetical protein
MVKDFCSFTYPVCHLREGGVFKNIGRCNINDYLLLGLYLCDHKQKIVIKDRYLIFGG